jgi:hypothetical protein
MQLAGSLRRQPRTIPLNFGPGDRIEIVSLSRIGRVCAENVKLKRGSSAFFHLWECANLPRASSLLTDSGARLRLAVLGPSSRHRWSVLPEDEEDQPGGARIHRRQHDVI